MIRKLVTSAAVLALSASSLSAYAYSDADGAEIHFFGKIQEKTCTVSVDGVVTPGNASVTLPETKAAELRVAGQTAGDTPFTISLKDCKANASSADIVFTSAYLDGDQLQNVASQDAASNVALEITDNAGTPVDLRGMTPTALQLNAGQGSAIYKVRYYATGIATPGAVEATAMYIIGYP